MATFIKTKNEKVWQFNDGIIKGVVALVAHESTNFESFLDQVSEAATGSIVGLSDFSYTRLGQGYVQFEGAYTPDEDDDNPVVTFDASHPGLAELLAKQYGISVLEAEHALDNVDNDYGQECVVKAFGNNRELRSPAYPDACSYVRVVLQGTDLELAYWTEEEWASDPAVVMGAVIGALHG